jgi:hypothetical protein
MYPISKSSYSSPISHAGAFPTDIPGHDNRLFYHHDGSIEITPKHPAFVLGELMRSSVEAIYNATRSIFSAFDSFFVEIDAFSDCEKSLTKVEPELSLCEIPRIDVTQRVAVFDGEESLEANLQIAGDLMKETFSTIQYSVNYLARSDIKQQAKKQGIELNSFVGPTMEAYFCLADGRRLASKHYHKKQGSLFDYLHIVARIAKRTRIGNCGEMAALTFFNGLKKGLWIVTMDYVSIVNGDHSFVVIGRDKNSDPTDYRSWGANAVVLDAWEGKIFKGSELEKNLSSAGYTNIWTGQPSQTPFNPNTQSLSVNASNSCMIHLLLEGRNQIDLNDEQAQLFDALIERATLFNNALSLDEKVNIAKALSESCDLYKQLDNRATAASEAISTLKDQMSYLIEISNYWG